MCHKGIRGDVNRHMAEISGNVIVIVAVVGVWLEVIVWMVVVVVEGAAASPGS